MSKTLGEIAFETYRENVEGVAYDGSVIPEWRKLSPAIRNGWEAGAKRVSVCDSLSTLQEESDYEPTANMKVYAAMAGALALARKHKLGVAADKARFYAVAVTEQEKAVAYMRTYVLTLEELEASPQLVL